ncbi:MAG TPA: purine-nucleoside phosphorylase [Clostridiales bacterium]|nr:purine-nucleoside phosphorylase [Clostridia bacterium]HCS75694.1 purine-nucleoside phosphorylase [Clostridiales bacterium]
MFQRAAEYIKSQLPKSQAPKIGLILGSGLGVLTEHIEKPVYIPYKDIPGFPQTTVEGHAGRFVYGSFQGKAVLAMQGRFHYYEGKSIEEVVFPVRVMKILGIEILILTNAAGGVNPSFQPGDLMLITDHINMSGVSPLRGKNLDVLGGPRFPDMTFAYNLELRQLAIDAAKKIDLDLKIGVYAMMLGPNFETPAEIRMLRILGADAVGMSTIPEAITAVHAKIKVLGISCITNMAAGILKQTLTHEEVLETAKQVKGKFIRLLETVISII